MALVTLHRKLHSHMSIDVFWSDSLKTRSFNVFPFDMNGKFEEHSRESSSRLHAVIMPLDSPH